ncbi:hypothetical protein [Hyphobacterium marinum]|uniref:Ricin B lectin domain-containing protein n=1 Tax=Hyphobacterium marinum TaxID=3116574 RepID=A0ABU7M1B4_9PROT|nr:hypothetical protein [Hyphobacterium sp. Y6023]MEE2567612.1 hypothetical protein [Hyphobacterium sp. Y6023]
MRRVVLPIFCVGSLLVLPTGASAAAQSVETVTFRVPVEVTDIRYLSSVNVRCAIQDGTRTEPLDLEDWSNSHMISNLVRWRLWSPDFGRCVSDPTSEEATRRCMTEGEGGGYSWSGVIEVPIHDFQGGRIRVAEAENYSCKAVVHYDTEPDVAGEAGLEDGLCAGFFENPFSIDARERYQVFTGGDIAEAELCSEGRFDPSAGVITVERQFIRDGEYDGEPGAGSSGSGASTPATINPALAERLPDNATLSSRVGQVARTQVTAPLLTQSAGASGDRTCHDAVQGRIAWNQSGNTQWADANVNALCEGAESSDQPAACFDRVMHQGVERAGGGQWRWQEVRDLCRGSRNAGDRIACYESRVASGASLSDAISSCN